MSLRYLVIACIVCFLQSILGQDLLQSPCPGVFRYEKHNASGYHPVKGVIRIQSRLPLNLTVKIFIPALLQSAYGGRFLMVSKKEEIEEKLDGVMEPNIKFNLIYPADRPIPRIKLINLNGQPLCSHSSPLIIGTVVTYSYEMKRAFLPLSPPALGDRYKYFWSEYIKQILQYIITNLLGTIKHPLNKHQNLFPNVSADRPNALDDQASNSKYRPDSTMYNADRNCGRSLVVNPLVVGGSTTKRGRWPWLVALYKSNETSLRYSCGATLISDQFLLTAAHCVEGNAVTTMKAYIGKYDLSIWNEPDSQLLDIIDAHVHPDYTGVDGSDFHSDIALLKLEKRATPSRFVVPACLSLEEEPASWYSDESEGIVVGWGNVKPEGPISKVPKMVTLPIVSRDKCIDSNIQLRLLSTNTTICAGRRNGEGPCNGDSGSGLLIAKSDEYGNIRWFLRGIASLSLRKYTKTSSFCDLGNYVLFTDVLKYRDWLSQYISA